MYNLLSDVVDFLHKTQAVIQLAVLVLNRANTVIAQLALALSAMLPPIPPQEDANG